MRVICLFALCSAIGFQAESAVSNWITNADQITDEWLRSTGEETGYTEHIKHLRGVFENFHVRTFIEFGVGFSTKYFIDHSEKVISVEFVTPGTGPEWLIFCMNLYRDYSTWTPVAFFSGKNLNTTWATHSYMGAESVYRAASYQPVHYKSYAKIDPNFVYDLRKFVKQQVAGNNIDMAFVDSGVALRGDLVQVLFNQVPIIVAHDVAPMERRHLDDVYGYGRIVAPDNYEEIFVPFGMGTAFWIKKEEPYLRVIEIVKAYIAMRLQI